MQRITFLGVLLILAVLVSPTLVGSAPAGPPGGLDVNVVTAIEPVASGDDVLLNVNCAGGETIYTVPDDKLLIIEDASATANDSANTAAIIADANVSLSLTAISGGVLGRHRIAVSNEIPLGGGRTMRVYADPGTDVDFRIEGCNNAVNARVSFSGQLISLE